MNVPISISQLASKFDHQRLEEKERFRRQTDGVNTLDRLKHPSKSQYDQAQTLS